MAHSEYHRMFRMGWLRAAVLGANDGIVSTASLIVGVAAASAQQVDVLVAGLAGLVAGAMSMAAGEYVSVHSQHDSEQAELNKERQELLDNPEHELHELSGIYRDRGLPPELADEVARQLMAHDALGSHARDELGISAEYAAQPLQAAIASAAAFGVGAALPLGVAALAPRAVLGHAVMAATLVSLMLLGWASARLGGACVWPSVIRVTLWGALAMGLTAGAGALVGAAI